MIGQCHVPRCKALPWHFVRVVSQPRDGLFACHPHLYLAVMAVKPRWWSKVEILLIRDALRSAVAPVAIETGDLDLFHAYDVFRSLEVHHAAHR